MCVFGHQIRDFIPILPQKYIPHRSWRDTLEAREEALRNRHMKAHERLSEHTKRLPPLKVGDHVRIQNQTGPHPLKWDRTGIIIEVKQFDQYQVKVDGSNRTSLRNRKFLRKFIPAQTKPPPISIMNDLRFLDIPTQSTVPTAESPNDQTTAIPDDLVNLEESQPSTTENQPNEELCDNRVPCLRRSTRIKTRPAYLDDYVTLADQRQGH